MAQLFILLPVLEDDALLYAWRSAGSWQCAETYPESRFKGGEDAVAIAPGTAVTVHTANVAARRPADARRIAQFAVEDEVAEPVEDLHVALGAAGEGGTRTIHVVAAADMRRWSALLAGAGLADADIVAAHEGIPQGAAIIEGPQEILFRTPATSFALDAEAPADLISSLAPEAPEAVYGDRAGELAGRRSDGPAPASREAWLVLLAGWLSQREDAPVSLRQGDHGIRRPLQLDGLSRWRRVAALAAAVTVTWMGSVWLETAALTKEAAELRARTSGLVTAAVPDANGNLQAALAQLREDQRVASSAVRPTEMSAALYEAVVPAGNAEIRSLRFDGGAGRLIATVVFDNYSDADEIGRRLEQSGLAVSLGGARQSGNRVLGEFTLEAAS